MDWLTIATIASVALIVASSLRAAAKEHPFARGELLRCCLQLGIAVVCGAPVWFSYDGPSGLGRGVATLGTGFAGAYFLAKLYFRLRFGKGTKVTMG